MTFIRTCYILVTLGHRSKIRLIYNNGNAFYSYKIGTMCNHNHPMIGLWAYTNSGSIVSFLILYVDDILIIGNDIPTLQSIKTW